MNDLEKYILKLVGKKKLKKFHPHAIVDSKNKCISIYLEDCSYYGEWIKGEGGDIAIYRANDDERVVGAHFPLRVWNGKFPVDII